MSAPSYDSLYHKAGMVAAREAVQRFIQDCTGGYPEMVNRLHSLAFPGWAIPSEEEFAGMRNEHLSLAPHTTPEQRLRSVVISERTRDLLTTALRALCDELDGDLPIYLTPEQSERLKFDLGRQMDVTRHWIEASRAKNG